MSMTKERHKLLSVTLPESMDSEIRRRAELEHRNVSNMVAYLIAKGMEEKKAPHEAGQGDSEG